MADREIPILFAPLDSAHSAVICVRLVADCCMIGGQTYTAAYLAAQLDSPISVDAVMMSSGRMVGKGDTLAVKDLQGTVLGRSTVICIELSHTDLLTDEDRRVCAAEALDDPSYTWALILTSGPIWCFRLQEPFSSSPRIRPATADSEAGQEQRQ